MKPLSEVLDVYNKLNQYFIGQTIHNSISIEKENNNEENEKVKKDRIWSDIWSSILDNYITTSNKREFYLNLSYTLLTMLSSDSSRFTQLIDVIYNDALNFNNDQLKYQFILNKAIQKEEVDLLAEFLCFVYCAVFKTQDIQEQLYESIRSYCALAEEQFTHEKDNVYIKLINDNLASKNDIFVQKLNEITSQNNVTSTTASSAVVPNKSIRETLFEVIFRYPNVTSVLDKRLQLREWPNVGPIFWLWFHLTSGMFVKNNYIENCNRLKEYFLILDHYICPMCAQNFREKKIAIKNDQMLQNSPVDIFIIKIHSMIRVSQMKNNLHYQFIDKHYMENLSYIDIINKFSIEYQQWWD